MCVTRTGSGAQASAGGSHDGPSVTVIGVGMAQDLKWSSQTEGRGFSSMNEENAPPFLSNSREVSGEAGSPLFLAVITQPWGEQNAGQKDTYSWNP